MYLLINSENSYSQLDNIFLYNKKNIIKLFTNYLYANRYLLYKFMD